MGMMTLLYILAHFNSEKLPHNPIRKKSSFFEEFSPLVLIF
jgi:hypothetical protein